MTPEEITRQIDHVLRQGWTPALEHVEPERAAARNWYLWKLPLFGALDSADVRAEIEECARAHPVRPRAPDRDRPATADQRAEPGGPARGVGMSGAAAPP